MTARYVKADDMARAVLCGALLAVVSVAPALAWTGSITPLPTLAPKRSLKQAQCSCYTPNFNCTIKTLYCPSGALITNPLETFNCTYPSDLTLPQSPCLGAPTVPSGPATLTCPNHVGTSKTTYCQDGIPIDGGSVAGCTTCQRLDLRANCDINAVGTGAPGRGQPNWSLGYGRADITCPSSPLRLTCTSVGQVITPASVGCTATSPAACTGIPSPLFWYNSHLADSFYYNAGTSNTLPDKITCTAEMVAGTVTCLYRAGALPCNQCLNKNGAVNVVVGPGAAPKSVASNPVGCATPFF